MKTVSTTHVYPIPKGDSCPDDSKLSLGIDPPEDGAQAIAKWWLTQTPTAYTVDHTGAPLGAAATHALSIIALLNEALRYDRLAIEQLVEHRVPCNDRMLEHPTIQTTDDGLGMLGILNGIVGAVEEGQKKGCGWIAAVYDDDENLTHFRLNLPQSE